MLWDKKNHTIVNNESSEIIRIFNTAFNEFISSDKATLHYYPEELRTQIDEVNEWIYPNINSEIYHHISCITKIISRPDGVYRAGFATTQEAYEKAVKDVFDALDKAEKLLEGKDYLIGDRLTEADIRLWVTIVRPLEF